MLSHDEQRRLDGIQSHLGHDDPAFAARMRRRGDPDEIRPATADPSAVFLFVNAVVIVAAWVEVGVGWLGALVWVTSPIAVVVRRGWRRQQDPGHSGQPIP